MNGDDFSTIRGIYKPSKKDYLALSSMLFGYIIIEFILFNEYSNRAELMSINYAYKFVLLKIIPIMLLKFFARTVIVKKDSIESIGLFGLFSQKHLFNDVESIKFGGFLRNDSIDVIVKDRKRLFVGNPRFTKALNHFAEEPKRRGT